MEMAIIMAGLQVCEYLTALFSVTENKPDTQ
jgi:hypothetical protein